MDEGSAAPGPERLRNVELEPATVLAAVAMVLAAFPVVALGFSNRRGPYVVQTYLFWSDLPLMALGLLCLPALVRTAWARRLDVVTAVVVLVGALTVAWAAHPSLRGFLQVLRLLGVAGAVLTAQRGSRTSRLVLGASFALFTLFEVLVAALQRATGGPVGLRSLGEPRDPLLLIGGAEAPSGTLVHPYLLAGLAIIAMAVLAAVALKVPRLHRACALGAAVAGIAVGITYSRMALLALAGILVPLLFALRSRSTRAAVLAVAAAVVIGTGVTALVASDGWVGRAEEAATGENLTRGRGELATQAIAVIRSSPLIGVGTGRYVLAVEEDPDLARRSVRVLQPVHGVPLLLTAEGGILTAGALVLLAVALVQAARRGGAAAWIVLLAYVPFLLLDHFPVTFPQGMVMTAVWLVTLALLAKGDPDPERDEVVAEPARATSAE